MGEPEQPGTVGWQTCPHCRTLNRVKAKFCSECGFALQAGSEASHHAPTLQQVLQARESVPVGAPPAQPPSGEPQATAREATAAPTASGPAEARRPQWGRLSLEELKALKRELVLVFADLARPAGETGQMTMAQSVLRLERRNDLVFPLIQSQGGRLVKTFGYSVLVQFDEPAPAVRTAIAIQKAFADTNRGRLPRDQIQLRIALTAGTAVVVEDDIFGEIVNGVARLCKQCPRDRIVISEALFTKLKTQTEFQLRPAAPPSSGESKEKLFEVVWSGADVGGAETAPGRRKSCPQCGAANLEKALFCGQCGTSLEKGAGLR